MKINTDRTTLDVDAFAQELKKRFGITVQVAFQPDNWSDDEPGHVVLRDGNDDLLEDGDLDPAVVTEMLASHRSQKEQIADLRVKAQAAQTVPQMRAVMLEIIDRMQ